MNLKEFLDLVARYVWPLLLSVLVVLFTQMQDLNHNQYELRLHVAENYTSKQDLKEMLAALEERMDKRLGQLLATLNKE